MKQKAYLSYGVTLLFLVWCVVTFRGDIAQINAGEVWKGRYAVLLAMCLSIVNYGLRVVRWHWYLARLDHTLGPRFVALTYFAGFAFTLSPGKIGEMARARYYQRVGIGLSSTAAAFFIERLIDLLSMLGLAFLALASTSAYASVMWIAVAVIALMFVVFILTPWIVVFEYVLLADWIAEKFKKLSHVALQTLLAAQVLLKPRALVVGVLIGLLAWGAEGTGLWALATIAPDIRLDWISAVGIYSVAIIVGALSFLPGGLGSTEAVMVALLTLHGFVLSDAILITLVCRAVTLWFAVLLGWVAVGLLRFFKECGEVQ